MLCLALWGESTNGLKTVTEKLAKSHIFILLLLATFASIGAVMISPALPEIARHFHITDTQSQLVITVYMFGFAFGHLLYGPLSNRYGRKPFIALGILISGLSCLVSLFAAMINYFPLMVFARLVMSLAGSACLKMSYNIIADLLDSSHLTKMISFFVLSFAIAPPVGIAIGGFLTQVFGWESVLYSFIAYSIVVFFFSLKIPETLTEKDVRALCRECIVTGFKKTLSDKPLILGSLLMGCANSVIYLFATEVPFISSQILGLRPNVYGILIMLANIGMVVAGLMGSGLAKKMSQVRVVLLGFVIFFFSSLTLLVPFYANVINLWTLFLPMAFILFGSSLAFTNSSSIALGHAPDKSYASSVMSFINLGFTVFNVFLLNQFSSHNLKALPTMILFLSLIVLFLWWRLRKVVLLEQQGAE